MTDYRLSDRDQNGWRIPKEGSIARQVYDLKKEGKTHAEIGKKLGLTTRVVYGKIRKMRQAEEIDELGPDYKRGRLGFGDLKLVDAMAPLRLQPIKCDVEGATPRDPANCVFARAAMRQFGATKVLFWKNFAYVDLVGRGGKRQVERFSVSLGMRKLLKNFDAGKAVDENRAFILNVPAKKRKLAVFRKNKLKYRKGRVTESDLAKANLQVDKTREQLALLQKIEKPKSLKLMFAAKQAGAAKYERDKIVQKLDSEKNRTHRKSDIVNKKWTRAVSSERKN